MSFFAASPFLKALGWGLFHSLWQFAVCWLIYRTLASGIKKMTAPARHTMAVLLLFAGTISFIGGLSWKYYADTSTTGYPGITLANTSYYTLWHSADRAIDVLMPYWSLLYLLCVSFLLIKFCLFVQRAGNLQHNGITKMAASWRTYVQNIATQLGIHREVKALLSVYIDTPQVIGFFKPVILLPAACLVNLSTEQLEAVLLHELVHIKRNDYLVNVFVTSIEILFFFNPFVKQLTASIRKEREFSCDDMVIQFQYHPHNYASALLTLEKSRLLPVTTYGIAASGRNHQQLLTRIERIMGIENRQTGFYRLGVFLVALLLLGFVATINPAKVAPGNFAPIHAAMLFTDDDNNTTPAPVSNEQGKLLITGNSSPRITIKMENKLVKLASPANVLAKIDRAFNATLQLKTVAAEDNDEDEEDQAQNIASRENIDFSLPQKETPVVPEAALTGDIPEPYVPASSFSFQLTQDTFVAKYKGETYNERMAKDAFLKVQKAMQQINWQQIEKQFKFNRKDIAKLKNELALQIKNLNWQQINNDVKLQGNLDQMAKLHETLQQNEAIKQYRQTEAYHEALARQLTEQEQLLKETEQRQEEARKAAVLLQQRVQAEMKKRRIIYL